MARRGGIKKFPEPTEQTVNPIVSKPVENAAMNKNINVQPIKIMILSNVPGQKEPIPFTKALLYHPDFPDLSKSDNFNEYPYISDNVSIDSLFNDFNTVDDYSNIVKFFFDKKTFVSKLSSNPNLKFVDDDNDTVKKNKMLVDNFKEMLRLLFPTSVPFTDNVKNSYDDYLVRTNKLPTVSYKSFMEYLKIYKLSFLNMSGKEYTISSVTWLNDVINSPGYSALFDKFKEYKAWSKTTTKKLKKKKIELFLAMAKVCQSEFIGPKCKNDGRPSITFKIYDGGIYKDTNTKASQEIARLTAASSNVVIGEDTNRIGQLGRLKDILSTLARASWELTDYNCEGTNKVTREQPKEDTGKIDEGKVSSIKTTTQNYKKVIAMPYSQLMSTLDDTNDNYKMETIQGGIDYFQISELKILHDELNKRALFSNKFRDFVLNLSKLYEQSLEIDNIWNRLNNRALYADKPVPAEYSKITTILKDLNEYESSTRESTNIDFQEIIDDYVAHKDKSDETLMRFIGQIASFKSSRKSETPEKTFEVGLARLQNRTDPTAPSFEAFLRVDLLGGVLNTDNIGQANCMFYDKKLAANFRNIRNKITVPEWQVSSGNFITLPANAPQTTTRRAKTTGGNYARKTRKRYSSSIRRK